MKADIVLAIANKASESRKSMNYLWDIFESIKKSEDPEGKEFALRCFLRKKERFSTLMECIHIASRDAGQEYRRDGWGRDDS